MPVRRRARRPCCSRCCWQLAAFCRWTEVSADTGARLPGIGVGARKARWPPNSFTLDVQVRSVGDHRDAYPSATAKVGTQEACRVHLAVTVSGAAERSELASSSQWVAPAVMASEKPELCEQDRQETLDRILLVVAPPAN